jgi:hypothetical protein
MTIKISAQLIFPKDQRPEDYYGFTSKYYNFQGEPDAVLNAMITATLSFWEMTHNPALEDLSEVVEVITDHLNSIQGNLTRMIAGPVE